MKKHKKLKIGDAVIVNDGVMCPDHEGVSLAGWQGRVVDLDAEEGGPFTVGIQWDSLTLRALPDDYVRESEVEGLDWSQMYLYVEEVEPARPRDKPREVEAAIKEVAKRFPYAHLEEEGERIQEVLTGMDPENEGGCFAAWAQHLQEVLSFPFAAEVFEFQERGPLQSGDRVQVRKIEEVDEFYGLLVDLQRGRREFIFPLCDLEVIDKKSPNYQPVKDYAIWFANR